MTSLDKDAWMFICAPSAVTLHNLCRSNWILLIFHAEKSAFSNKLVSYVAI